MIPALKKLIEKAGDKESKSFKKHTTAYDMDGLKKQKAEEEKTNGGKNKKDKYKKGGKGGKGGKAKEYKKKD